MLVWAVLVQQDLQQRVEQRVHAEVCGTATFARASVRLDRLDLTVRRASTDPSPGCEVANRRPCFRPLLGDSPKRLHTKGVCASAKRTQQQNRS